MRLTKKRVANAQLSLPKLTERQIKLNKNATEHQLKNIRAKKLGFKNYTDYLNTRKKINVQKAVKVKAGQSKKVETELRESANKKEVHIIDKVKSHTSKKSLMKKINKQIEKLKSENYHERNYYVALEVEAQDTNGNIVKKIFNEKVDSKESLNELLEDPLTYMNNRKNQSGLNYIDVKVLNVKMEYSNTVNPVKISSGSSAINMKGI